MVIEVREVHPLKAYAPMLVTPSAMLTVLMDVRSPYHGAWTSSVKSNIAPVPEMVRMPLSSSVHVREPSEEIIRVRGPEVESLSHIAPARLAVVWSRAVPSAAAKIKPLNGSVPLSVTLEGMVIEVREVHLLKAFEPITALSAKTMEVKALHSLNEYCP